MSKKEVKKTTKTPDVPGLAGIEARLSELEKEKDVLSQRIDRIVDAISKSKKVKGL